MAFPSKVFDQQLLAFYRWKKLRKVKGANKIQDYEYSYNCCCYLLTRFEA